MPSTTRCSAITHTGRVRSNNEDAIAVSAVCKDPLARWSGSLSPSTGWALVADGMGGHAAGEVASRLAVEFLRTVIEKLQTESEVASAINAVNQALYCAMDQHPELSGFGTTIAGICLRGDHALIFNVGDSRIYISWRGVLRQLSHDDAVAGYLLTQCLGGVNKPTNLSPHFLRVSWPRGASFLLCSDGLTDMVPDDHIQQILDERIDNPADALIAAALEKGGVDNVSAIVIGSRDR